MWRWLGAGVRVVGSTIDYPADYISPVTTGLTGLNENRQLGHTEEKGGFLPYNGLIVFTNQSNTGTPFIQKKLT